MSNTWHMQNNSCLRLLTQHLAFRFCSLFTLLLFWRPVCAFCTNVLLLFVSLNFLSYWQKENANTLQASHINMLCTSTHVRPCTSALASQPAVRRAQCVLSKLIIATNVASSLVPRSRQRVSKLESRTKWRGEEGGRDKMMLDQPPTVKEGWKCASEERDSHSRRAFIVPYLCACLHLQGILDMLVLSQAEGKNDLIIHALKNNFEADAYFVKVMGKWLVFPKCAPSPSKSYLRKKKRESRKASFSFTHLFLPQEPFLHLHGGIKMEFFFFFPQMWQLFFYYGCCFLRAAGIFQCKWPRFLDRLRSSQC